MKESNRVSIEKQIADLPPLPITVSNVMRVTGDPESSANDLAKTILPDQAMCVAILKIANSALYGRPKKVSSLEKAIAVLGMNEVESIVLGKAAVTTFKQLPVANKKVLDTFWDHGFTCGLAARSIGEHLSIPSGQFFIAELLHDIGKLAMLLAFGEKYETTKWMTGFSTAAKFEEEKHSFSMSHDILGSRLLQHWQFPETLLVSLQYHHMPHKAPKLAVYPLIVQIADFLSFMILHPEVSEKYGLKTALHNYLPNFEEQWRGQNFPWEDIYLDQWFAWLKVDRDHGCAILDILAA